MSQIIRHYTNVKTVLKKQPLADFFTISKYSFSPYRACEHGCFYCDGRAEKYYVEGTFDRDIVIRKNIPDLLENELKKLREPGFLCIGSGVSDPYQPVENDECIMRRCAEILLRYDFPVVVMTKSSLVLRDLDIWSELNRKCRFLLMVSLTFSDDNQRRIFEPKADTVHNRIQALTRFKSAGCCTGVLAMPLLPFITETADNMNTLAHMIKSTGADFCMPGGLTLRPGIQKETFFKCLEGYNPRLIAGYEKIYAENRLSGAPLASWRKSNKGLYQEMRNGTGLPSEIPHYVFKGHVPLYEEVYLVLCQMKIAYEEQGVHISRLQKATKTYYEWVLGQRMPLSRSKKRSFSELDDSLIDLCRKGAIGGIIGNEKLGEFISRIVLERAVFDTIACELRFLGGKC